MMRVLAAQPADARDRPCRPTWLSTAAVAAVGVALLAPRPATAADTPEPVVVRTVTEDARVRIEETRVRGALQRIVVEPKGNGAHYEITPPTGAVDPSQSPSPRSGERRWRMFSF